MKKMLMLVTAITSSLLLCSYKPENDIYTSILARKDYFVSDVLSGFKSSNKQTVTTTSHILNNEVGRVTMNYEVISLLKYTDILTSFTPAYVMLYEANVYLNNNVHYKGGFANWCDGYHPGFLNDLRFSFTFNNVSNAEHYYCTPSKGDDGNDSGIRLLKDVMLEGYNNGSDLYKEDTSSTHFKGTNKNCFSNDNLGIELDWMDKTANSIYSNSYFWSISSSHLNNLMDYYDSRVAALVSTSKSNSNNKVSFVQDFSYNKKVSATNNGTSWTISVNNDNNLYSGPATDGKDDDKPLYFTFFGNCAVQSSSKPTSIDVSMYLDTWHGSHVYLDTFESSAVKNFTISL